MFVTNRKKIDCEYLEYILIENFSGNTESSLESAFFMEREGKKNEHQYGAEYIVVLSESDQGKPTKVFHLYSLSSFLRL
jgi:hypothetical protein